MLCTPADRGPENRRAGALTQDQRLTGQAAGWDAKSAWPRTKLTVRHDTEAEPHGMMSFVPAGSAPRTRRQRPFYPPFRYHYLPFRRMLSRGKTSDNRTSRRGSSTLLARTGSLGSRGRLVQMRVRETGTSLTPNRAIFGWAGYTPRDQSGNEDGGPFARCHRSGGRT